MEKQITPDILRAFPEYDGESSLVQYASKFNRLLSTLSLSKVHAYKIIQVKLTGRALRAFEEIEKEGIAQDYQSLLNELLKKLTTDTSKVKARCEMAMKMQEGEELSEFASRVRNNVLKAYPTADKDGLDEIIMSDTFCRGLPPFLSSKMMTRTYSKLNDALEDCEKKLMIARMNKNEEMEQRIVNKLTEKLSKSDLLDGKETKDAVNYMSSGHNSMRRARDYGNFRGNSQRRQYNQGSYNNRNWQHQLYQDSHQYGSNQRENIFNDDYNSSETDSSMNQYNNEEREDENSFAQEDNDEYQGHWDDSETEYYEESDDEPRSNTRKIYPKTYHHINTITLSLCIVSLFVPASCETYFPIADAMRDENTEIANHSFSQIIATVLTLTLANISTMLLVQDHRNKNSTKTENCNDNIDTRPKRDVYVIMNKGYGRILIRTVSPQSEFDEERITSLIIDYITEFGPISAIAHESGLDSAKKIAEKLNKIDPTWNIQPYFDSGLKPQNSDFHLSFPWKVQRFPANGYGWKPQYLMDRRHRYGKNKSGEVKSINTNNEHNKDSECTIDKNEHWVNPDPTIEPIIENSDHTQEKPKERESRKKDRAPRQRVKRSSHTLRLPKVSSNVTHHNPKRKESERDTANQQQGKENGKTKKNHNGTIQTTNNLIQKKSQLQLKQNNKQINKKRLSNIKH